MLALWERSDRSDLRMKREHLEFYGKVTTANLLDLQQANTESLIEVGVLSQHIELISKCTSCEDTSFFSFHRDHMIHGEMISWISF